MGVAVPPKAQKVIIFYSQQPDGSTDQYSLHGGCAVKKGIKWSANFWIWNGVQNFRDQAQGGEVHYPALAADWSSDLARREKRARLTGKGRRKRMAGPGADKKDL